MVPAPIGKAMTTPETPVTPAPSPEASSVDAPHTASPEVSVLSDAVSSSAPTSPFGAPAPAAAAATTEASEDDASEGDDEGSDTDAKEEGAAATGEGGEKKKRRRRRRKKKPGAPEGARVEGAPAEGGEAPAEGAEATTEGQPEGEGAAAAGKDGRGPRPAKRPRQERPEKERPAFALGDVVFGKVLETTEDVLFIDLSGKGKAIFDLRELLISEEDAKADLAAEDDDHEPKEAAGSGEPAPVTEVSPGAPAADTATSDPPLTVEQVIEGNEAANGGTSSEATPEPVAAEAAAVAEASVPAPAPAKEKAEDASPQLPRVILEPGAPFVGVVHNDGGRGGLVVLTHHPKRLRRAKPLVAAAFRDRNMVFGIVTGVIKGGVEVDVDGLRAFAPGSHMDLRLGADLHPMVGKRLGFAVTQYGKRGRDVVLSRRAMLESESKERREEALKSIQVGATVDGIVRTVVSFGAFVDIGGVEGLVPLSEMSHNRADQPKDVFKVGETVRVKILRVDEKQKIWLSRRSTVDDPWAAVATKYAAGTKHSGKVARLKPFGAFIELEPGVDGLIQVGDLSVKRIEHPNEVLKEGDTIDVVVAYVEPGSHRIALHPAPTGAAANETPQKIAPQRTVRVQIVSTEAAGLTVRILGATGRHARGFITAGATGTPRGSDLRKEFPVGKELDAKIVEIDPKRGELKLSIRAMNEDTERNAYQQYRAQVKREAKFGTLADLLQKRNIVPQK